MHTHASVLFSLARMAIPFTFCSYNSSNFSLITSNLNLLKALATLF